MEMMICYICGTEISDAEKFALRLRLSNLRLNEYDAPSQVLGAHNSCFVSVLHMSVPFDAEVLAKID
jgi:hypothetical protein